LESSKNQRNGNDGTGFHGMDCWILRRHGDESLHENDTWRRKPLENGFMTTSP
jgi:hypothetical protein